MLITRNLRGEPKNNYAMYVPREMHWSINSSTPQHLHCLFPIHPKENRFALNSKTMKRVVRLFGPLKGDKSVGLRASAFGSLDKCVNSRSDHRSILAHRSVLSIQISTDLWPDGSVGQVERHRKGGQSIVCKVLCSSSLV